MKRNVTKARLNDLESKYRTVIESDECEQGTMEAKQCQHTLLRAIVDFQGMMDCGPVVFQTMKMYHDGLRWIIELEAVAS